MPHRTRSARTPRIRPLRDALAWATVALLYGLTVAVATAVGRLAGP
jgi:hypothetical protein